MTSALSPQAAEITTGFCGILVAAAFGEVHSMGSGSKSLPESLPGSRYELEECVAVGGMASVYRGTLRGAAGFRRPVAIKRTHAHVLENEDARAMILREALNASAVRHPNVVSIDDVEEVGSELLMVMEFVAGASLARLLKAERLPVAVTLAIVLDACAGLEAIHSARRSDGQALGIVHRDVSPQNIMIGFDGIAKITDFGIAKRVGDPQRTAKNLRRGKFGYMAPEYIRSGASTPASDVFSLGVVLWEALAGRRLFDGESALDAVSKNLIADVPRLHPEIPEALDDVLASALAPHATERCGSAAELASRIAAAAPSIATRAEVALALRRATTATRLPAESGVELVEGAHEVARSSSGSGEVAFTTVRPAATDSPADAKSRPAPGPRACGLHPAFRFEDKR